MGWGRALAGEDDGVGVFDGDLCGCEVSGAAMVTKLANGSEGSGR
jgi:hypothetical protein